MFPVLRDVTVTSNSSTAIPSAHTKEEAEGEEGQVGMVATGGQEHGWVEERA